MTSTFRHLSILLAAAFALTLGLSACDGGQQSAPDQGQEPAGEQQTQ